MKADQTTLRLCFPALNALREMQAKEGCSRTLLIEEAVLFYQKHWKADLTPKIATKQSKVCKIQEKPTLESEVHA